MKYLIISDIHGSLPALEKALKFYDEQHCDMLCVLGDILNYGPRNRLPEGLDPKGIAERHGRLRYRHPGELRRRGRPDVARFPDSVGLCIGGR